MNHSLKHWKEAATLIVAAEQRLCGGSRTTTPPRGTKLTQHLPHASRFDYNTLLLKRSGKSGFMPNAYVFPGGLVDPTDFSSEWLDVFKSLSSAPRFGLRRVKQKAETRPPVFATDRVNLGSPIPGEVAFRICALRETFEESGVLLVVPRDTLQRDEDTIHDGIDNDICPDELKKWRSLVNQNPANFIRMCRELGVLPNIWALHEWSNWLTPEGSYGVRRFDTAFFICCLKEIPHTLQDQKEIELFQWSTPSEVLQSYEAKEFWIAPPQFYELGRLCQLPSLNDLHRFARERAVEGCEHWMPVVTVEDDKLVSLLPGDRLYPGTLSASSTGHDGVAALHRLVIEDSYTVRLQINIPPKYKHLLPVLPLGSESLL
ncbi:acyl-coenzyme A diphosphatase NUDT19 [Eucyclogobius newberryi]|uniref:acyl-coenzyme A diphosphatase NUDT19 n=1 Tax=Eucyclogobius newberryi TaxID=166745 RepID=UPI003B59815E